VFSIVDNLQSVDVVTESVGKSRPVYLLPGGHCIVQILVCGMLEVCTLMSAVVTIFLLQRKLGHIKYFRLR